MPSPFDILVSDKISAVVTAALFIECGSFASRVGAGIALGGRWRDWVLELWAASPLSRQDMRSRLESQLNPKVARVTAACS